MKKELRVGIFGLGRGGAFVGNSQNCGGKIVAFCEKKKKSVSGSRRSTARIAASTPNLKIL